MERYPVSTKPFNSNSKPSKPSKRPPTASTSILPPPPPPLPAAAIKKLPAHQGGIRLANKPLLTTLKDPKNPIAHSDVYARTEHVATWANGHENGHTGHGPKWMEMRAEKLLDQGNEKGKESRILKGVKAYINGSTGEGITNLALIALIQTNGGEIKMAPGKTCTHILSTTWLSGSKTERYLTRKKNPVQVVSADWIIQSVLLGKRQPEARFSVIFNENQQSVISIFSSSPDNRKRSVASMQSFGSIPFHKPAASEGYQELTRRKRLRLEMEEREEQMLILDSSDDVDSVLEEAIVEEQQTEEKEQRQDEEEEEEEEEMEMPSCGQPY